MPLRLNSLFDDADCTACLQCQPKSRRSGITPRLVPPSRMNEKSPFTLAFDFLKSHATLDRRQLPGTAREKI